MADLALNPDFLELLREFGAHEVRYMVVGGIAFSAHAVPRYTKDLDVWIDAAPDNAVRAWNALAKFGAPLRELTPADLATPGTYYQVGVPPRRIDVLNQLVGVSFEEAWPRRVEVEYGGIEVHVIGREDLIRNKRASNRPSDRQDLRKLLPKPRRK